MLKQAITFAKGKNDHVIVLSIPDWSVTPFAKDRDRNKIAAEIGNYNQVNKNIALAYHVHYIDITPGRKEAIHEKTLIAPDGLHPSAKEYERWAEKIYEVIYRELQ